MRYVWFWLAMIASVNTAYAQGVEVCRELLRYGVYDEVGNFTDSQNFNLVRFFVCSSRSETEEQSRARGSSVGVDIPGLVGGSFGSSSASATFQERKEQFCLLDYAEASSSDVTFTSIRSASNVLASAFTDCIFQMSRIQGLVGVVQPNNNYDAFAIRVSYRSDTSVNFGITGISATPAEIVCDRDAHLATPENPIEIQGVAVILCENLTPESSFLLAVNTTVGTVDGPEGAGMQMVGQREAIEDISRRLQAVEGQIVPVNTIAYFSTECPPGWGHYAPLDGRYAVGTSSAANLEAAIGQQLGEFEDRPTGDHTHAYEYIGVFHPNGAGADYRKYEGLTAQFNSGSTTGLYAIPGRTAGAGPGGTNAPYLTLRACQKQ